MTLPNILTFTRLVLVPIVFWLMYETTDWAPIWAAHLFVGASITDWLDGYLARKVKPLDCRWPSYLMHLW